jgi:dihydroorotate dehydrogenase (NAD+) catalytic subunit
VSTSTGVEVAGIDLAPARQGGLHLRHPLMVAAGGGGFGAELLDAVGEVAPSAVVTRGVTRAPERGDPPPRMAHLRYALLHAVGTPNPGLEAMLRRQAPRWATFAVPIIVNVRAVTAEDIAAMARTLDAQPDVAGLELDLAAPGHGRRGRPIGFEPEAAELATVAARAATDLPLVVKLTASAPDVRAVAKAVAAAGADAISATAPIPALALDPAHEGALLGAGSGGLSGPAIKPLGLHAVFEIAQSVKVPVIGLGGVHRLEDVLDYLAAGASAVGLATAALAEPTLPGRLAAELGAWCDARGLAWQDLIGRALPASRRRSGQRRGRPGR